MLDVACGGGDVALGLWRRAEHAGLRLEVEGLDRSPVAVEHARAHATAERAAVEFRVADVVAEPLPAGFDAIVSSLFLHHLAWTDAVRLLAAMKQAAGRLVVVSDLRRSGIGYLIAQGICRLVTRSPIVHVDGPRSVAGAFTLAEVRELCREAGLTPVRLKRSWPWRYLLTWERQ